MFMRKTVVTTALVFLFVLMLGSVATAGTVLDGILKKGELVVGMTGDQPPLNATTKDGELIGFDADLARAIAMRMNLKIRFARMPFAELLPALQAGKVDMIVSGMTMTPERNLKVAFIGPYHVSGKGILTKIKTLESLKKEGVNNPQLKVATLKGSTSQQVVEKAAPKARLTLAPSYDGALKLLFEDKVDAVIADYPFCAYVVARYPDKELALGESKLSFEPLGIAVREDTLWINGLDNFIRMLIASGEMNAMQERWFKSGDWIKQLP
jgi:polar amino acid transport system substrate-binding protein